MIKAEDLRIGDLVKVCCDCEFPKDTVCIVSEIGTVDVFIRRKGCFGLIPLSGNDDNGQEVWDDDIEGIPLTPEILELNGWDKRTFKVRFQKSLRERYVYTLPSTDLSIEYCPYYSQANERFTMYGDCFKIKHIQYVHELQHILWALGYNAQLTYPEEM